MDGLGRVRRCGFLLTAVPRDGPAVGVVVRPGVGPLATPPKLVLHRPHAPLGRLGRLVPGRTGLLERRRGNRAAGGLYVRQRAEARVGHRSDQVPGHHGGGSGQVDQAGLQRRRHLRQRRPGQWHAGLGGVPAGPVEQLGDQVLALRGQAPQLVGVELGLRLAQLPAHREQLLHPVAPVPGERVDQPGARRRPAQRLQLAGQVAVAGRAGLAHQLVPGDDEPGRRHEVQLGGDLVGLGQTHPHHDARIAPALQSPSAVMTSGPVRGTLSGKTRR